jgi:ribosomal protein S27AE
MPPACTRGLHHTSILTHFLVYNYGPAPGLVAHREHEDTRCTCGQELLIICAGNTEDHSNNAFQRLRWVCDRCGDRVMVSSRSMQAVRRAMSELREEV